MNKYGDFAALTEDLQPVGTLVGTLGLRQPLTVGITVSPATPRPANSWLRLRGGMPIFVGFVGRATILLEVEA